MNNTPSNNPQNTPSDFVRPLKTIILFLITYIVMICLPITLAWIANVLPNSLFLISLLVSLVFMLLISLICVIKIVPPYERMVIFRLGRILDGKAKGPGIVLINPFVDTYKQLDIRMKTFNVNKQEILTKDSLTIEVDAVVFYRITDPKQTVCGVDNADSATQLLAQTTLRNCMGTRNLQEILQHRENLATQIRHIIDPPTNDWGITVERVEIKDISLPKDMQRSMAAEAEAIREARAKVVEAEGERNAARALKEASEVMSESSSALQLRYLQTLSTISTEHHSTVIFPLPIDMMSAFEDKKDK